MATRSTTIPARGPLRLRPVRETSTWPCPLFCPTPSHPHENSSRGGRMSCAENPRFPTGDLRDQKQLVSRHSPGSDPCTQRREQAQLPTQRQRPPLGEAAHRQGAPSVDTALRLQDNQEARGPATGHLQEVTSGFSLLPHPSLPHPHRELQHIIATVS